MLKTDTYSGSTIVCRFPLYCQHTSCDRFLVLVVQRVKYIMQYPQKTIGVYISMQTTENLVKTHRVAERTVYLCCGDVLFTVDVNKNLVLDKREKTANKITIFNNICDG